MGLNKGHEGNVQPTGDPIEDARRFNHPVPAGGDGRTMVRPERLEVIENFFLGEKEQSKEQIQELKLNPREKSLILKDPRFLYALDARLFDTFFGLKNMSRSEERIFNMVLSRLGLSYKNYSMKMSKNITVGKISISPAMAKAIDTDAH